MVAPATAIAAPDARRELGNAKFGLSVFLFSKTMFFVALIGAMIVLRHSQPENWPPPGTPELQVVRAAPATALLLVSALTILLATRGIRRDDPGRVRLGLLLTLAIGIVFAGLQLAEWSSLYERGLRDNTYSHCYYVLTGFHMLYVIVGLGIFCVVTSRALRGRYSSSNRIGIDCSALWWHFVGVVWAMLFVTLYVLPSLQV